MKPRGSSKSHHKLLKPGPTSHISLPLLTLPCTLSLSLSLFYLSSVCSLLPANLRTGLCLASAAGVGSHDKNISVQESSLGKKIGTVNTSTNSGGANVNGRSDEPAEARKNTVIAPPGVANRQNINSQLVFRERDHNGSRRHRGAQASQARFTAGSIRFAAVLAILSLSLYNFFLYLARDDIPTSESLLLALIFIAVAVLCARKNKGLLHQIFKIFKQKLGFSKNKQKPVQWFSGESKNDQKHQSIVLEGVGFYINGDFYEGEFHKGRCNGSGVYNYFVNGRYEGDWIEGKYDGFGIESWATWVSAGKD